MPPIGFACLKNLHDYAPEVYVKMQVHKCKNCFWGNAFIPLCIHWENPLLETEMVSSMDNGNSFILGKSGCIQSIHRRIILLYFVSFFSRNKNGAIYFGRKSKALTRLVVATTGQSAVTLEDIFKFDQVRSILI